MGVNILMGAYPILMLTELYRGTFWSNGDVHETILKEFRASHCYFRRMRVRLLLRGCKR